MNEVKSPKKPLIYYYMIVVLLVLLFNLLAMPWLAEHQIKEVDYNTFVSMTEKNEIGQVEIQQQSNRILFTSTDGKTIYKTAIVPDDGLVQRLLDAGISTTGEEIEQTSLLTDILGWVLPLVIFIASIMVPTLKMIAIAWLCWNANGNGARDSERMHLIYEVVEFVGRWSMIDVFVIAVLSALVRMGGLMNIYPAIGAVMFALVVVMTMFSAMTFDPRLLWDREPDSSHEEIQQHGK